MIQSKSQIEKKLEKLNGKRQYSSGGDNEQLIFPSDLTTDFETNLGHCVVFEPNIVRGHKSAYKRPLQKASNRIDGIYGAEVSMQNAEINGGSIRGNDTSSDKLYTKTNERIVLPMPISLTTTYAAQWSNVELGAFGRLGEFADSLKNWKFGVDGVADKQLEAALTRTLAGAASKIMNLGIKDYVELSTGWTQNPFVETLFKGMSNRMIPFTYNLSPKNLEEAEMVRAIIHRFKYHMLPEFKLKEGNNSFILHPSTFDISFLDLKNGSGSANPWLHRMSTCALTNLTVNGTPNGEYTVNKGGNLTSVTVDLFFQELTLLSKEAMGDPTASY